MCEPLVSVIIPVYNVEKYFGRCIESIVNQTYKKLEIILVDDGSVDSSPEICDDFALKDKRIKVIHKENAGAGLARNSGLDIASGEYVLFVDSDDYIDINTVEKCVGAAEKDGSQLVIYGRTDADTSGRTFVQPVKTDIYVFRDRDVTEKVFAGLFTHSMGFGVGVCGKLISMQAIRTGNLRFRSEREILSEDAFFLTELFAFVNSVSIVPENYYYYVTNGNSFSRTFKSNYQEMNDRFLVSCLDKCREQGYSENVINCLKVRYQIYSLEGMKQVAALNIPEKEKIKRLKKLTENQVLKSTLSDSVISLNKKGAQIYWHLFRLGFSRLCYLLLRYKIRK